MTEQAPMYTYCKRCRRHVLTRRIAEHCKTAHKSKITMKTEKNGAQAHD